MLTRTILLLLLISFGCGTPPPTPDNIKVVTAIPTEDTPPTSTPQEVVIRMQSDNCNVPDNTTNLPDYTPSDRTWITADQSQLYENDSLFNIEGINYYPRMSPFDLFLTDSETDVIDKELDIVITSGVNTLRIFLNFDQLFLCEQDAIPDNDTIILLDGIIQTIINRDLRLIIVLYQDIDNYEQTNWEQLQFIVRRYASEAGIIAWDVLDKGDEHYPSTSSEAVLTWLSNAIRAIRQITSQHLITTSWVSQATDTIELVDIVSFQHYADYQPLRQKIANLKADTQKPILLSAIGYSTFDIDETAQRNLIFQAIEEVRNNELAGWLVYTAFDYPTSVTCIEPDCPAKPSSINFYGIWNTSYFEKLAVDAIKRVTESN